MAQVLTDRSTPERLYLETLFASLLSYGASYDDRPKRRLFELLKSQGMQANQQVVFLSDGGEDVRNLQFYLNPQAEHLLDWFHVTLRLTVLTQTAKPIFYSFEAVLTCFTLLKFTKIGKCSATFSV